MIRRLLLLLLLSVHSWGAIAQDTVSASAFASATSVTWTHTTGAGLSNGELLVGCFADVPSSITSVKYATVTMTQRVLQSTNEWAFIYSLNAPTAGANSVVVTLGSAVNLICGAASFSGVDQTTPVDATNKADSTTANPSTSVTVPNANDWIFDTIGENGTTLTAPTTANTKAFSVFNSGGPSAAAGSFTGPVGTGSQSLAWTASSADWARAIVSLKPAAAATVGSITFTNGTGTVTFQNGGGTVTLQ